MFTILYPEALNYLNDFRFGLLPLYNTTDNSYLLVIKVFKEHILTARKNSEFKVYFVKDLTGTASYLGFVTAFFDDYDEPLVIRTGLFSSDPLVEEFAKLFSQAEFNVYFFDEHNRELFGAQCVNKDYLRFTDALTIATFPEFEISEIKRTFEALEDNFATRGEEDDNLAYPILLGEHLVPDDMIYMNNSGQFSGVNGLQKAVPITQLVRRTEPGPMQEKDIVLLLTRLFEKKQIFLNPMRVDTGRELTDILVITDKIALFIQAKDSPNTEETIGRSVSRKKATIRGHIEKATKQLRGALTFAAKANELALRTDEQEVVISLADLQLMGLIVVKELFDHEYQECSISLLELVREMQIPALLLDYSAMHEFTFHARSANEFVNGISTVAQFALDNNEFPKMTWNGFSRRE